MLEQFKRVHDCLMWSVAQPKNVIGGRNICVSDKWQPPTEFNVADLPYRLYHNPNLFKLRRVE